jgi:hypothetical protein
MQSQTMQAAADTIADTVKKPGYGNKLAVGLIPFSPVEFTGPDAIIAWGRLIGFSLLAYYTFNKMRPLSYAAMGAAGVSLATSLTATWFKKVADSTFESINDKLHAL